MASGGRPVVGGLVLLGILAFDLVARGAEGEWPPAQFSNSVGMLLVRIPSGEFRMGSTEEEIQAVLGKYQEAKRQYIDNELPAHKVRLTKAFLMGKHEVTVGQFRRFIEASDYKTDAETGVGVVPRGAFVAETTPRGLTMILKPDASWRKPYHEQAEDHPVISVSWNDAKKFMEWLNAKDKSKPAGWAYRLPTEAEWEWAARGPKSLIFPWRDQWDGTRCNFAGKGTGLYCDDKEIDDGFRVTAPVGSFSPKGDSPFGVCDMAGNVAEWCEDWGILYQRDPATNPAGPPNGEDRVVRGGSWCEQPFYIRSARRDKRDPSYRTYHIGFRVVLAPVSH